MLTRRTLIAGSGAVTGAAPAILRGAGRPPGDKPNLLFLWTDQQRADTMAAYGNHRIRVPALNRLAAQSIVFDRAYVTQPVCTPSRSSVLTGLWPHQNGCTRNNIPLRSETPAMPELLADASYRTAYMGKWHLGDEVFAQHGFQEWVSIEDVYDVHFRPGRNPDARSSYHHHLVKLGHKPDPARKKFSRSFATKLPIEHGKPAFLAGEAARFISENQRQPWMLYVNFLEPHAPYNGPLNDLHPESVDLVPANYPGTPVEKEPEVYRRIREDLLEKGFEGHSLRARAGWQRVNRNYAGLCSQVDQAVGQILEALEASGAAPNTIIVFTSDHGSMMGSHTLLGKSVLYEESVRIPLLLRAPFLQSRATRIEQPVSHINLVPTLLELMGRPVPESLPGESLTPLLQGKRLREDHVFLEWHAPSRGPNARAVISPEGWKLGFHDTDNCLLFQRRKDPQEMRNLYYRPNSADALRGLRRKIEAWQHRTKDTFAFKET